MSTDTGEEFDCIECARHIVRILAAPRLGHLCSMCIHFPGWYRDARVWEVIEPGEPQPPPEDP